MAQELTIREQQPLITATPFEKLLDEIRHAEPTNNIVWLWANDPNYCEKIVHNICTVYYYLTHACGMKKEYLTYEEYNITKEHLNQVAREEVRRRQRGIKKIFYVLGFKSCWHRYLKEGSFGMKTPWGNVNIFSYWTPKQIIDSAHNYLGVVPSNIKILLKKTIEEQILKN